ncbi:MAG: hypothetical protein COB46_01410 [Rhodospirillaceae bacterium]|nr:MAG: hypothetical protein COB46_01410 [Rhodospirillaceae bacterium]
MRIGIDFDNTIAGYDHAFVSLAVDWRIIDVATVKTKTEVREALRAREGGEREWQKLQGRVYGAEMHRASLINGVDAFLNEAHKRGDDVFIVSHKTEFGHFDPDRINLRDAARAWMTALDFFNPNGFSLNLDHVFFHDTREKKIAEITALDLDWFIDDLPEVFATTGFPDTVKKILFTNGADHSEMPYSVRKHWSDIQSLIYP